MREKVFLHLAACAGGGVGRGGEVQLEEVSLVSRDEVESFLPFHLFDFPGFLVFVDVVRLVIDDHQVGQRGQVVQLGSAQVGVVKSVKGIAGGNSRTCGQQLVNHGLRGIALGGFLVFSAHEEVPVGEGDQPAAGHLPADAVLLAYHVVLKEAENFVSIGGRHEQILDFTEIVGHGVAFRAVAAGFQTPLESVLQTVIHHQTRCHDEEVLCVSLGVAVVAGIQHLPQQKGVHHPRLARSGRHLHGELREVILRLFQKTEVRQRQ